MATGIMIMGSSGAGKTTLGNLVANELGYTFVDIDEYIWRKDTEIPFSAMYPKVEKISRLKEAISNCEHFVMAGSMNSFHEYFDPYFELVVHLHTDAKIRVKRVHERELGWFGERVLEGGDMYEELIRPFDARIFKEFGGIMHFCGRGHHYIRSASEIEGLYGFNLSQPDWNDMEIIYQNSVDKGLGIIGMPAYEVERAMKAGRPLKGLVHCGASLASWSAEMNIKDGRKV